MKRVATVLCCLVLAACAAGGRATRAPASEAATSGAGAPSVLAPSPRDEIERLDHEIDLSRVELKLDEPTPQAIGSAPVQPLGAMPHTQDPKCRPAQNDTCKTSCTLSDSICSNADKICELAKSMPGDAWATNKCAKANTTCEGSRTKCCGCQ